MTSEQAIELIRSVYEDEKAREIITALVGKPTVGDIVRIGNTKAIVTRVDADELSVMHTSGSLGAIERDRVFKTGENLGEQLTQLLRQIRGKSESFSD